MKILQTVALLAAAAALQGWTASAQVSTQELYNVRLRANCTPTDNTNGRPNIMTERHLIRHCVGDGFTARQLRRNYALVYNPSADRIQVVQRADGTPICDVLVFEGGTNAVASNRLVRFTFVFRPDQSNAIGSAVITERALNDSRRPRISGRLQFTWTAEVQSNTEVSETNTVTGPSTDPQTNAPVFITLHLTNSVPITDTNGNTIPDTPGGPGDNPFNPPNGNTNVVNGSTNTVPFDPGTPGTPGTDSVPGANGDTIGEFVQAAAAASAVGPSDVEICVGTFTVGGPFRPRNTANSE